VVLIFQAQERERERRESESSDSLLLTPEAFRATEAVEFIAEHLRNEDEYIQVSLYGGMEKLGKARVLVYKNYDFTTNKSFSPSLNQEGKGFTHSWLSFFFLAWFDFFRVFCRRLKEGAEGNDERQKNVYLMKLNVVGCAGENGLINTTGSCPPLIHFQQIMSCMVERKCTIMRDATTQKYFLFFFISSPVSTFHSNLTQVILIF